MDFIRAHRAANLLLAAGFAAGTMLATLTPAMARNGGGEQFAQNRGHGHHGGSGQYGGSGHHGGSGR